MPTLYNKNNVAVGVANLYVGPIGTVLPAESVDYGTTWGGAWVHPGATVEGIKFSIEPDTKDIMIEESAIPALVTQDTVDVRIETELSEDTLENMKLAYGAGGSIVTQAAASGVIGKKTLILSPNLGEVAVGFELRLRNGFWRRVLVPVCNSVGKTETSYRRSETQRTYPVEFRAICAVEDLVIVEKTANALP